MVYFAVADFRLWKTWILVTSRIIQSQKGRETLVRFLAGFETLGNTAQFFQACKTAAFICLRFNLV